LSSPSPQISTPPFVSSHGYSHPVMYVPSRSHQQSPGAQSHEAIWHWVFA